MFNVQPLSKQYESEFWSEINNKTKPLGALGQLETLAIQVLNIQSEIHGKLIKPVQINYPHLLVFAGDHGIADYGVSIAPSAVTGQMVNNFAANGAAINVFSKQLGWQLDVIDTGILQPINSISIRRQRLGCGTKPFHIEPAMSHTIMEQGFAFAKALVHEKFNEGCDLIAFGEMGIGNTSSASAIMSAIMELPAVESVGSGTGIDQATLLKKQQLIQQALDHHRIPKENVLDILATYGGFEIVQICGAMLAAAERKIPIVVDGFICTAAAMIAKLIDPNVQDYFIFAHSSGEQGHDKMLQWFDAKPLLNLDMRLGEGTGAALCLPLIQSALAFYNEMASFEQANVVNVVSDI
ncbi:MAG: nicotinate-nucleotide--dimethylbenzimidazole phosphoribosyltransferase [Psychrosphaera sp.]|jgi:nicotinate-nucleotide--dimethylbenzimidazole phosphoribosyltransferase